MQVGRVLEKKQAESREIHNYKRKLFSKLQYMDKHTKNKTANTDNVRHINSNYLPVRVIFQVEADSWFVGLIDGGFEVEKNNN